MASSSDADWRPATAADARRFFRIATMAHELLEEAHVAPLDDSARQRLTLLADHALGAVEGVLPMSLRAELTELTAPLGDGAVTDGELRVALAELVGWLDGTVASTPFMLPESASSPSH